ncbi:UNVERIFIED_CONTAM: hypothetical protein GTU68_032613 [Idotea baltica]|nr:hypothetical protein [Idotea baltica]
MVAQMAGAGFLALPKAIANAGWGGVALMVVFCVSIGFSAIRLGRCWVILEERWEEYKKPARQPYMEIAHRALGIIGRRVAFISVLITLIGSTIVFIILIAEMMNSLVPVLSQCEWCLIVVAIILPFIWLGSPKDFWQASVLAVLATVIAVVVIVVKMIVDRQRFLDQNPIHPIPSITTFSLGFGAILFSFGGASVFPTIQNDMKNRSDFWKSVIISFAVILAMYLPVGAVGYILIGEGVKSNILLSVGPSIIVTVAIGLQIVNLLGTFIISLSPVVQSLEDIVGVPPTFGWKRVLLRSSVIFFELMVAFAIPNFGLILNLIGGSTMSCLSFILPPLMYMKLVDDKSDKSWPERNIQLWEESTLWFSSILRRGGGVLCHGLSRHGILLTFVFKMSCFVTSRHRELRLGCWRLMLEDEGAQGKGRQGKAAGRFYRLP